MRNWGLAVIIAISLAGLPTSALELDVSTTIPEYIMEENLNLTGTASETVMDWVEATDDDFHQGTSSNLTIKDDSIQLEPDLEFDIMNNGDPVLEPGTGSDWDSNIIGASTYLKHNGTFYAFYHGSRTYHPFHIGVATSDDGISWTKYSGNPVIMSGIDTFDRNSAFDPQVIIVNGTWMMYYAGTNTRTDICLATSPDGFPYSEQAPQPPIGTVFI